MKKINSNISYCDTKISDSYDYDVYYNNVFLKSIFHGDLLILRGMFGDTDQIRYIKYLTDLYKKKRFEKIKYILNE